jgi:DNA repair protein RadC
MTPIKHWPSAERPREKLMARGADALAARFRPSR